MSRWESALHPSPDDLGRYLAGEMDEVERDSVQEHLASCPQCTQELLDLASFARATEEGPPEEMSFETAAAWRAFSRQLEKGVGVSYEAGDESGAVSRLAGEEAAADESAAFSLPAPIPAPPVPAPGPGGRAAPARGPRSSSAFAALAAGLLVALVGAGLWGFGEHRQARRLEADVARLTAPRTDVPVLYLDRTIRSSSETPSVSAEADLFLLMVSPPGGGGAEDPDTTYGLEVTDAEGHTVLRETDLRRTSYGTLRLALSRGTLAPGLYEVRVTRGEEARAAYAFEVLPPTPPVAR